MDIRERIAYTFGLKYIHFEEGNIGLVSTAGWVEGMFHISFLFSLDCFLFVVQFSFDLILDCPIFVPIKRMSFKFCFSIFQSNRLIVPCSSVFDLVFKVHDI